MADQRRKRSNQRRKSQTKRRQVDIWRTPPALPEFEPISVAPDVDALLRSLGDPPMIAGSAIAGHYFNAVVERAAVVAAALAMSAGALSQAEPG